MASPRRLEKLNMLLKEELARIIDREIDFPLDIVVTITRVETSSDMRYATAFISVFNVNDNKKTVLDILKKNIYAVQQVINRLLRIRPIPAIRFEYDEAETRREGIEKTLAELRNGNDFSNADV